MSWPSAAPSPAPGAADPLSDGAAAGGATYPVNVTTSGELDGSPWNLTILGQTWTTTSSSLLLHEPNGSYTYSAYSPVVAGLSTSSDGYDNGSFVVAGMAVTVGLNWNRFTEGPSMPAAANASSTASGLAPSDLLTGELAALLVVVIVVVAVVARRRPAPPVAPTATSPPRTPPGAPAGSGRPEPDEGRADPLGHML